MTHRTVPPFSKVIFMMFVLYLMNELSGKFVSFERSLLRIKSLHVRLAIFLLWALWRLYG